ncbi:ATP-grasp domain-containing protein [Nonomuraea insulae]|uniref:ATP-grasp domain-containing protein n=1 Tax=Nonomuraea insulae TaxID=1616787 RepID=UPI0036D25796
MDLRSSSPRAVWWLPVEESVPGAPRVVLADRAARGEFAALQAVLHQLGVPTVRLDAAHAAAPPACQDPPAYPDDGLPGRPDSLDLTISLDGGLVTMDGRCLRPSVVWARGPMPRAIPGTPGPAGSLIRADSWSALVDQLAAIAPASLPGRRLGRLAQLAGAAAAGVRTPRTIVTTDPGAAAAELPRGRLVVKVLDEHFVETAPGRMVGLLPEIADRETLVCRPSPGFPMIVQEYVEHDLELRVYYLAGDVHAFAVTKPSPDAPWRDPAGVSVRATPAPPRAVEVVRRLARDWGLVFGAFDLLLAAGEVVFLEVNADGDWRWFEAKAGTRAVTNAAALMVRTLHLNVLRATSPPPISGVLDFLLLGTEAL